MNEGLMMDRRFLVSRFWLVSTSCCLVWLLGCQPPTESGDANASPAAEQAGSPADSTGLADSTGPGESLGGSMPAGAGDTTSAETSTAAPAETSATEPPAADRSSANSTALSPPVSTDDSSTAAPVSEIIATERPEFIVASEGDEKAFSFKGQKPKLLLVLSGGQHGYLEPCGCAGLDKMKGGLGRRHTLLRRLEKTGVPVLPLDAGDLVKRSGPQAVIKYHRSIESLLTMKYRTVGFGLSDLRLQPGDLIVPVPVDGRETPLVSANIGLFELGDDTISARFRVFELGGLKVGVTTVLAGELDELNNPDLDMRDAEAALEEIVPQLVAANCDHLLLLVSGTLDEAEELAMSFPQFDFVVVAGDSDPPPPEVEEIDDADGGLIELSHKGMYVGLLGLFGDETSGEDQPSFRYQRVAIDNRFEDSAEMKAMLTAYQDQLQAEGYDRLGIFSQPAPHNDTFVGSKTCQECHESEFDTWAESGHAHAMDTLTNLKPPRHFDPECISCHVVGWVPQQYVPIDSGYVNLEKTPHLVAVGCENCHGPGGAHVAMERQAEEDDSAVDEDRRDALYAQMRLSLKMAKEDTCIRCHDLDNSPDFKFEEYWPKIKH